MKASEKKTVRWTVFRERVTLHYGDAHTAASEKQTYNNHKRMSGAPKPQKPDKHWLLGLLYYEKIWQTHRIGTPAVLCYEHSFRKITFLIIAILMPFKLGIEVDFDVELFIFFRDYQIISC